MTRRDATDAGQLASGPGGDRSGDDRHWSFSPAPPQTLPRIEIDEALRNNWFEIWYQPKINLKRKCLAGAEALARIRHPAIGVLWPASFLPALSDDGVMRLAEHALMTTLRNWSSFNEAGFNLHLAINVPVSVLLKLPIPTLVRENRPKHETWPGIILEVSEDQIVRDMALASEVAKQFRDTGITIAIDEFGKGFSSFARLRELPFAELKLDRSFVIDCASDATNAAICQTAIDLAHRFGSAAVAGGIETSVDLQSLLIMGCDFGQGVLIAPPMPKERFLALLRQRMNRPRMPQPDPEAAGMGMRGGANPTDGIGRVA